MGRGTGLGHSSKWLHLLAVHTSACYGAEAPRHLRRRGRGWAMVCLPGGRSLSRVRRVPHARTTNQHRGWAGTEVGHKQLLPLPRHRREPDSREADKVDKESSGAREVQGQVLRKARPQEKKGQDTLLSLLAQNNRHFPKGGDEGSERKTSGSGRIR